MDRIEQAVQEANKLHGLCTTGEELKRLAELAHNAEFIVEIGSYMGRSTKALTTATRGQVFSVDTWQGSDEDEDGTKTKIVPPDELYSAFIRNSWSEIISGKLTALRCDSVEGAKILAELGYTFDMIFIDAGHDYEWVTRDIKAWLPLIDKGGVMVGHDLPHPGMVDALNDTIPGWTSSVGMLWEYVVK